MEYTKEAFIAAHEEGKTFTELAEMFNLTRAAISGRARRLKLTKRDKPGYKNGNQHSAKKAKPKVEAIRATFKPNRYSFAHGKDRTLGMSKSDMRDMLKEAVENTK